MASENQINQDEIERLLGQSQQGPAAAAAKQTATPDFAPTPDQNKLESLFAEGGEKAASQGLGGKPAEASASSKTAQTHSPDGGKVLAQEDIEKLLSEAGKTSAVPAAPPAAGPQPPESPFPGEGSMAPGDVEYLLHQAERALASINTSADKETAPGVTAFKLEEFSGAPASSENATLDLIRDVELDLKIELGRTHMYLEDVLKLRKGSVVPLDKLAGDPVDIYVNGRLIARGEVLVLNDNFCVRVAELIAGTNVFA